MPNFANVVLTGHLGKDPETRPAGQTTATSFSVAVGTGFGDKKITTWWRATVFGKRGETAATYLKKGSAVTIAGTPSLRPWTDKEGNERTSLEVNVNEWSFAGSKGDNEPATEERAATPEFDDTIPF